MSFFEKMFKSGPSEAEQHENEIAKMKEDLAALGQTRENMMAFQNDSHPDDGRRLAEIGEREIELKKKLKELGIEDESSSDESETENKPES